ncbi:MAG TPA: YibE/F family protein [Chroococcales cyanobacterium]
MTKPVQAGAPADVKKPGSGAIAEEFVVGRVKVVTHAKVNSELLSQTGMASIQELVKIEIMEGPYKGTEVVVPNEIGDNPAYNVLVEPGNEVILSVVTENGGKPEFNIADYHRAPAIYWLLGAFLLAFLFFGGRNGLKSLLGLIVSVSLIALVLLPLSLKGINPLLTAIFICLIATVTGTTLVAGRTKKALACIAGTVGGVIVAGIAAQLVIVGAPLTGLTSEEAQILRGSVLNQPREFYSGLLAAGMLIGALGVIMDVGISIASSVQEVANTDANLTASKLYQSGMNVGRDIMGTMTNTLILAYTGGALPLLLLVSQMPSTKLINLDLVATEVAAALSGSLGLVLTIPMTAFAAAKLMARPEISPTDFPC